MKHNYLISFTATLNGQNGFFDMGIQAERELNDIESIQGMKAALMQQHGFTTLTLLNIYPLVKNNIVVP